MAAVTAIVFHRDRRSKACRVDLDGESWRDLPTAVVKHLVLRVGDLVDASSLAGRVSAIEPDMAFQRALRLMHYRDHSVAELLDRLCGDGYRVEVARDVVDRLRDSGILDDRRYAESRVRSLAGGRGYGRRRVALELDRRDIPPAVAMAAMDAAIPRDGERDRALELASRLMADSSRPPDRVVERIVRKGFSYEDARAAVRAVSEPEDGASSYRRP